MRQSGKGQNTTAAYYDGTFPDFSTGGANWSGGDEGGARVFRTGLGNRSLSHTIWSLYRYITTASKFLTHKSIRIKTAAAAGHVDR